MIPDSVLKLLKRTRFLHLATCKDNVPHVSLMNYTFYQDKDGDYVILTTPKDTTKYINITDNKVVSLLVHDWISAKNNEEPEATGRRNSLYELITNINKTEISSVSCMIDGEAQIIGQQDPKYKFFKSLHMNNDTIDSEQVENYIKNDDENALIVVTIKNCKITDMNNNIQQY